MGRCRCSRIDGFVSGLRHRVRGPRFGLPRPRGIRAGSCRSSGGRTTVRALMITAVGVGKSDGPSAASAESKRVSRLWKN